MKCECECRCGGIPSRDAMNDRLYWVEIITGPYAGTKCAAWRNAPYGRWKWLVDITDGGLPLDYADEDIRVIHEIIPED